jgi:hypothetical protein
MSEPVNILSDCVDRIVFSTNKCGGITLTDALGTRQFKTAPDKLCFAGYEWDLANLEYQGSYPIYAHYQQGQVIKR